MRLTPWIPTRCRTPWRMSTTAKGKRSMPSAIPRGKAKARTTAKAPMANVDGKAQAMVSQGGAGHVPPRAAHAQAHFTTKHGARCTSKAEGEVRTTDARGVKENEESPS